MEKLKNIEPQPQIKQSETPVKSSEQQSETPVKSAPNFKRMMFKESKVWLALTPSGAVLLKDGKALIKYNLDQDYEYWVKLSDVHPIDEKALIKKKPAKPPKTKPKPCLSLLPEVSSNAIRVYTDGASSGNPGHAGIGVLLMYGKHRKEISRYIGTATNNIAELMAIKVGLEEIKRKDLPVRIFSDSEYAIGVITGEKNAKANQDLIAEIVKTVSLYPDIKFIKVKGHVDEFNLQVDKLAVNAVKKNKT